MPGSTTRTRSTTPSPETSMSARMQSAAKSDDRNSIRRRRETTLPYLLIAPTVGVLVALSIYPLFYAVKVSLQTGSGAAARWSLANFARLATDNFFLAALAHTFIYAVAALTFEFLLGLGLAVLLDKPLRGRSLFRGALLIPMMLPPVVVGVV